MKNEDASSNNIGTILVVTTTILLAALVLILCTRYLYLTEWEISAIPAIFVITNVFHVDDYTGKMNYDSRIIVLHTGTKTYDNANLKAYIFRNGEPLGCAIETLNGNDFISTVHLGVQWIGYAGCSGATWAPGEMSAIDLTDGTFHPGDEVQIDIIDKSSNQIISRHKYRVS
ncbi:MAG: hypothetical protein A4E35_01123 [Methanoregula sp. PtaU1.Bin051]|nr:MAG: hypothetical protein A4E35_01123 [Methanoregula sp. PtaU1.Bin051]